MLIINADDFGRSRLATDSILSCHQQGSVTSTSAMVFMDDSERGADLAKEAGIDVGLHLNFTQRFTQLPRAPLLAEYQGRIVRFLTRKRYAFLFYHPGLSAPFHYVFQAQLEEFLRLYRTPPSHFDGHHHMHLCANMLIQPIIPKGQKVRRNLSFGPKEKSLLTRSYRALIDKWLARRYRTTDFLFSCLPCLQSGSINRAVELARASNVEISAHPEVREELDWLMGPAGNRLLSNVERGTYAQL